MLCRFTPEHRKHKRHSQAWLGLVVDLGTECDLGSVSPAEPVTVEIEAMIPATALGLKRSQTQSRHGSRRISRPTWCRSGSSSRLHTLRSYQLVRYPIDRSDPPTTMESPFTIDHPSRRLIGWSVVNPEPDTVYECRWLL